VSEFLVEAYVSRSEAARALPEPDDVSRAADELSREGNSVRLLRSIFVPEDETCFYLFLAQSIDAVRKAAKRAGLQFEHVAEVAADWSAPLSESGLPARDDGADQHGRHELGGRAETARARTAISASPRE
jgi:hypothetical protein